VIVASRASGLVIFRNTNFALTGIGQTQGVVDRVIVRR